MNQFMEQRYVAHSQKFPLSEGFLYAGEDVSLQRKVILFTNESYFSDAYVQNIRKASSINHDGFLHILDTSFEENEVLIVLKHRPGKPLIQELNHRIWTFHEVISMVADLGLSMLDAMEEQITGFSVVAENVWWGEDGRLSIINYWDNGEAQTQGAIGLCGLLIQLFSGSAEIPGYFEALALHLDRIELHSATDEQKQTLVKLVNRVCQGQASLSSLIFGLNSLRQDSSSFRDQSVWPSAAVYPIKSAEPASDEMEEDEEEVRSPFPIKTIAGLSGLLVFALFIWMLWPSSHPERSKPEAVTESAKPQQVTPEAGQPQPAKPSPNQDSAEGQGQDIMIPNLIGMPQADAEKQALASGLHYNYMLEENPQSAGTVFKQDPAAGTKGAKGGNITFWVGKASQ